MSKKRKIKLQGLVSADITPTIDDVLAKMKMEPDLNPEKVAQVLSSKKHVNNLFKIMEDQLTDLFLSRFTMENFRSEHAIAKKNSQAIVDQHEDMFQYFFAYIQAAHTVYRNFIAQMERKNIEASKLDSKDLVNLVMYGNLCRLADQVGVLLINGYSDGALIVWRTFYEYCVVAVFLIKKDSNRLASRFQAFSLKQQKRKLDSYSKRCKDLKFPPPEPDVMKRTDRNYKKAEKTYGKDFFQNDYSWAQPYLQTKANFMAIEEVAGFGRLRPYYIWASGKTHPTYSEIMDFRDSTNATVLKFITLQETSRRAFVDPAQLTIASFHEVNTYFLHRYSGHEYDINWSMFRKIYEQFGESLSEEKVAKSDSGSSTS